MMHQRLHLGCKVDPKVFVGYQNFLNIKLPPTILFSIKTPWDIIQHNILLVLEDIHLLKKTFIANPQLEQVSKKEFIRYIYIQLLNWSIVLSIHRKAL